LTDTVFLVNPASANGSTRRAWPEIAHRAAAAGLDGETFFSDGPGGIAKVAERAAGLGAKKVVVVGGDGTVNEAVNGLLKVGVGKEVELAVIPRGTGTDFVRTFRIPMKLDEAIVVAREGEVRALDAGQVSYRAWDGSAGSAFFANVASAGMSGAVAMRANSTSKALGGKASFLWATLAVFARWRNARQPGPVIPQRIIERPPTAELREDQLDTDSLPPYDVLDPILEAFIEDNRSVDEITAMGFERATVTRVLELVKRNEYKRRQAPPGVRVSGRAFGRDWRYPITSGYRPGES